MAGSLSIASLRRTHLLVGAAVLLLLAVLGCAAPDASQDPPGHEYVELLQTTFNFDRNEAPYRFFRAYRISPGDVLDVLYQVKTWQEQDEFRLAIDHVVTVKFVNLPELNETERIRPDGKISLPYLGEVYVVGITVKELTEQLQARYSKILKSPELYVLVPEFQSAIKELKKDLHTAPRGLSRLVTVRPDGYATFAMMGDVKVVDRTIPDVSQQLNDAYEKILPGLAVDLFLEKHSGHRVYVLGDVGEPGAYAIPKPMTVIEALALAGSHLPTSDIRKVAVVRRHNDKMVGTFLDLAETLDLDEKAEFFFLKPDDIVYVPRQRLSRWADVTRDIADVLFFRGWSVGATYDISD